MAAVVGTELEHFRMVIDGQSVEAASGRTYETVDPYSGPAVGDGARRRRPRTWTPRSRAARAAFEGEWGAMTGFQRAALMRALADLIKRDADRLAELETRDSASCCARCIGQMRRCPRWYLYFAGSADKLEGRVDPAGQAELPRLHAARAGRGGRRRSRRGTRRCCC